jgi:hypothetical protein
MKTCPYIFPNDDQEYEVKHTRNGILHRDPGQGPALIVADDTTIREEYRWKGQLHREDGPAARSWYRRTGKLSREAYKWHGTTHRQPSEGPALLVYDQGVLRYEAYYFRDKFYRDPSEGPSRIWRDEQGNICRVRHSVRKDLSQAKQMLERAERRAALLPRVPPRRPFSPAQQPQPRGP